MERGIYQTSFYLQQLFHGFCLVQTGIDATGQNCDFNCMKFLKLNLLLASIIAAFFLHSNSSAQISTTNVAASQTQANTAIVPVPRTDWAVRRQTLALQRAKENPGDYDIEFIGDSITDFWEGKNGTNVWQEFYGHRKCINMGVSGDRTQHVLWRFEQGQLDGIKAKVAVVMIGTNNSNNHDNTEGEILEGVTAIVNQIRARQPDTKIILLGIFPRGETFSAQRGKILQVNEALAKLDDGKNIFYMDLGPLFIESNGSISKSIMPDYLHPNEAGYRIWAKATEPKLKQLLGE
jgi:lysophospholipase L1-like esterase